MLPRLKIAYLPTPLEPLTRLSTKLGGPNIFVKRDDLTGLAFGGNKTRKLEFLLAEAQANGAKTLITAGAVQSNHCRQTAAAAARFGFKCVLVLTGKAPLIFEGNTLLDHLMGAEFVWSSKENRDKVLQSTFDTCWENGRRPYLIPYGGSNGTGVAGFAYALEELLTQHNTIDWLVFATSSGGTQAGLMIGASKCSWPGKILGISVDEPESVLKDRIRLLIESGTRKMNIKPGLPSTPILVNDSFIGEGYGIMGQGEKEAITLFAEQEGLILDPVYTGRAAAGLIDLVRKDFFKKDETVVFWHTGGTPALFSNQYTAFLQ